jgi:glycine cleavage system H protein
LRGVIPRNFYEGEVLMKEINELILPDDLRYAQDHEWARVEGDKVRVGIDDYAQDQLGDIVFVELPQPGETLEKGQEFATVESVKAVVECYLPVSGEIVAVNKQLEDSPELMNKNSYGDGWMVEVNPKDLSEMDSLMSSAENLERLKGAE